MRSQSVVMLLVQCVRQLMCLWVRKLMCVALLASVPTIISLLTPTAKWLASVRYVAARVSRGYPRHTSKAEREGFLRLGGTVYFHNWVHCEYSLVHCTCHSHEAWLENVCGAEFSLKVSCPHHLTPYSCTGREPVRSLHYCWVVYKVCTFAPQASAVAVVSSGNVLTSYVEVPWFESQVGPYFFSSLSLSSTSLINHYRLSTQNEVEPGYQK
jgi:hypothetical protein